MEQIFSIRNIIIYLVVINLIAFLSMYIDKRKAKKHSWRIPEKTLLTLAFLGGEIGALCGMYKFRHKTKKPKFYVIIPMSIIVKIIIFIIYKI